MNILNENRSHALFTVTVTTGNDIITQNIKKIIYKRKIYIALYEKTSRISNYNNLTIFTN